MNYIKKYKRVILLLVTVLLIFIVVSVRPGTEQKDVSEQTSYIPRVNLYSLNIDNGGQGVFQTTGEIVSESRISIKAQLSEVVDSIYVDIGDNVYRGQTLMQLNNGALLAQKRQLEASVSAESASLDSIVSGTRDEQLAVYVAQQTQAQTGVLNARSSLNDKVQDAFTKTDDLVHSQLDIFFDEPLSNQPSLKFTTNNSEATRYLESERVIIEQIFERWELFSSNSNTTTLEIQLATESVEKDLQYLRTYTNTLASVVNSLTPSSNTSASTITTWKTTVSVIRNSINGAITTLVVSKDALLHAESALTVARNQLLLAQAGATDEQIRIGEARLRATEASLESLMVTLSKTTITSPISGTVIDVAVEEGSLVSPGQLLISIVNTKDLSVTAYIGSNDLNAISLNAPVSIEGKTGRVIRIAPGVNRETQKIEITIVFDSLKDVSFVDGQFVNVNILSGNAIQEVPLSAIASIGDVSYVYSVSNENTVVAHEVQIGVIIGEKIEIISGLENIDSIIKSTRGIDVGKRVIINN